MSYLFSFRSRLRNTIHHFRSADWVKIRSYRQQSKQFRLPILDLLRCSWLYGASFLDYYHFRFD